MLDDEEGSHRVAPLRTGKARASTAMLDGFGNFPVGHFPVGHGQHVPPPTRQASVFRQPPPSWVTPSVHVLRGDADQHGAMAGGFSAVGRGSVFVPEPPHKAGPSRLGSLACRGPAASSSFLHAGGTERDRDAHHHRGGIPSATSAAALNAALPDGGNFRTHDPTAGAAGGGPSHVPKPITSLGMRPGKVAPNFFERFLQSGLTLPAPPARFNRVRPEDSAAGGGASLLERGGGGDDDHQSCAATTVTAARVEAAAQARPTSLRRSSDGGAREPVRWASSVSRVGGGQPRASAAIGPAAGGAIKPGGVSGALGTPRESGNTYYNAQRVPQQSAKWSSNTSLLSERCVALFLLP